MLWLMKAYSLGLVVLAMARKTCSVGMHVEKLGLESGNIRPSESSKSVIGWIRGGTFQRARTCSEVGIHSFVSSFPLHFLCSTFKHIAAAWPVNLLLASSKTR